MDADNPENHADSQPRFDMQLIAASSAHSLYRLNVSRFVTRMANEHVYCDPLWLSGDRLAKLAAPRAPDTRPSAL
jgi:hypothetical protein